MSCVMGFISHLRLLKLIALPYPVIIESSQPLELISLSRNPPLRDRQKEKSFITHQIGIGVLIILWGLLYTGFWMVLPQS